MITLEYTEDIIEHSPTEIIHPDSIETLDLITKQEGTIKIMYGDVELG